MPRGQIGPTKEQRAARRAQNRADKKLEIAAMMMQSTYEGGCDYDVAASKALRLAEELLSQWENTND